MCGPVWGTPVAKATLQCSGGIQNLSFASRARRRRLLAFVIMIILLVHKASYNNVPSIDNIQTEARKTRLSLDKSTDSHS